MKVVLRSGRIREYPDSVALSLLRSGSVKPVEPEQGADEPEVEIVDYAAAGRTTSPQAEPATIRRWAAEAGIECPPKGRVPKAVRDAYDEARPS